MAIHIVKKPITKGELAEMAKEEFGDMVKAVVDVDQGIMAVGGELHADEQVLLIEKEGSMGESTWGINVYPKTRGEDLIEFDSMVNLKPAFGNRSRSIESSEIREKIKEIVKKLVVE